MIKEVEKMSETLYVKYNSLRRPEFQTVSCFVREEGRLFVEKHAASPKANPHLQEIAANYRLFQNYYNQIHLLPCEEQDCVLRFPFLRGPSLLSELDFSKSLAEIRTDIVLLFDTIFDINREYVSEFQITESFRTFFLSGEACEAEVACEKLLNGCTALTLCDLDPLFSNFIRFGSELFCIDYEWTVNFPVPLDFLKYRMLRYLYNDKLSSLEGRISVPGFLRLFGFSGEEQDLFMLLDNQFQEHVHGKNRAYLYTARYEKPSRRFDQIIEDLAAKNIHIANLETAESALRTRNEAQAESLEAFSKRTEKLENTINSLNDYAHRLQQIIHTQQEQIKEYRKCMRNPLYGAAYASRKLTEKISGKLSWKPAENSYSPKLRQEAVPSGELRETVLPDYETWILRKEATENARIKDPSGSRMAYRPLISVLVPVYNVLDRHLIPCIESVLNQTYQNLELCLADDCSTWPNVRKTLQKYEKDPRVKIIYREQNGHISECTNTALAAASGEFAGLLDCDDLLSPYALYEIAARLNENPELDFIYSDEDKVDDDGQNRHYPHFKPDWSPDTLMSNMYTCHFTIYRTSLIRKAGGLRTEYNGSQDYDLALRIAELTTRDRISHIDKILYHWRERPESTSMNAEVKPYVFEASRKAKLASLARRHIAGTAVHVDIMNQYNIVYETPGDPLVSILIPSKDHPEVARRCVSSIVEKTDYRNFEILLIDNGSNNENRILYEQFCRDFGVAYLYVPMEFNFSRMNNLGASKAKGEYLALVNDDIEITDEKWLGTMLGQAMLEYAGAVGCKLLYPDTRLIQHIGVINLERGPAHMYSGLSDEPVYPFGRNRLHYNLLAVTAACLVVKKSRYFKVGGMDESFAVSYNDVDFCMKLYEVGYFNVVRNDVVLLHHESLSRGDDLADLYKMQRLMQEEERLYGIHPRFAHRDPFYNRHYSKTSNDFSLDFENFEENLSKVSFKEFRMPPEKDFNGNIDRISVERYLEIEGWCLRRDLPDNDNLSYSLVLKGEGKSYRISVFRIVREDVAKAFPECGNISRCGFRVRFHRDKIRDGRYEIFLVSPKGSWRSGIFLVK